MLLQTLRDRILPWVSSGASERTTITTKRIKASDLPAGVEMAFCKISGKRVIVKGQRIYGNKRFVLAEWPEAQMHEVTAPQFIYVLEGQVSFAAGNHQIRCGTGNSILVPAGIPHAGRWVPGKAVTSGVEGQTCLLLWLTFYQRGVQCWFQQYDNNGVLAGTALENYLFLSEQVIQTLRLFIHEALGERDKHLCDILLEAFFMTMLREVAAQRYLHPGPFVKAEVPSSGTDFLQDLTKYIQQHLHEPLRLEQVARQAYMSPTQFMRRMRQETGHTFVEFLTDYRIKEAKILLGQSEWSVQEIATFVGYTSPTYFHGLFQREVGCTPLEYRSQSQKTLKGGKKEESVK